MFGVTEEILEIVMPTRHRIQYTNPSMRQACPGFSKHILFDSVNLRNVSSPLTIAHAFFTELCSVRAGIILFLSGNDTLTAESSVTSDFELTCVPSVGNTVHVI
jgi:hypothetical protein